MKYGLFQSDEKTIGFDGHGVLELGSPQLQVVETERLTKHYALKQAVVAQPSSGQAVIEARKGLQDFVFFLDVERNLAFYSDEVLEIVERNRTSFENTRPCIFDRPDAKPLKCNFGTLKFRYMIKEGIKWENSKFCMCSSNEFLIRLGKEHVPNSDTFWSDLDQIDAVIFDHYEDYIDRQKRSILEIPVPRRISLCLDHLPAVFNLSTTFSLMSYDFARCLQSLGSNGYIFHPAEIEVTLSGET